LGKRCSAHIPTVFRTSRDIYFASSKKAANGKVSTVGMPTFTGDVAISVEVNCHDLLAITERLLS
tara:strand:+ start:852 stop:1046 length:195 start_codon:yes stop_codon:yes gene_type:complete